MDFGSTSSRSEYDYFNNVCKWKELILPRRTYRSGKDLTYQMLHNVCYIQYETYWLSHGPARYWTGTDFLQVRPKTGSKTAFIYEPYNMDHKVHFIWFIYKGWFWACFGPFLWKVSSGPVARRTVAQPVRFILYATYLQPHQVSIWPKTGHMMGHML